MIYVFCIIRYYETFITNGKCPWQNRFNWHCLVEIDLHHEKPPRIVFEFEFARYTSFEQKHPTYFTCWWSIKDKDVGNNDADVHRFLPLVLFIDPLQGANAVHWHILSILCPNLYVWIPISPTAHTLLFLFIGYNTIISLREQFPVLMASPVRCRTSSATCHLVAW